jgi:hypothetical protein
MQSGRRAARILFLFSKMDGMLAFVREVRERQASGERKEKAR